MYENNDIFIGWSYIKALFDCLHEISDKKKRDQMVTPRYIFRGITQRHFSSSREIYNYLMSNTHTAEELHSYGICAENLTKWRSEVDNGVISKELIDAEERCYIVSQNQLQEILCKSTYHNIRNSLSLLSKCTTPTKTNETEAYRLYQLIKPRFIRSGAAVRLKNQQNRTQHDYISYLKNLIVEAKSRYPQQYKGYKDLEILADLQHKGGATCLVDFSTNFLISLWFATQDYANKDPQIGYVFCYDTNTDAIEKNNLIFLNEDKESRSIEDLIMETQRSLNFHGDKVSKFMLWRPSNINTRIARQDSVFIFGIEKFEVSKHSIFTLPIPPHWKGPIQSVLKDFFGITGETLYADADGIATSNGKGYPLKTQTKYFNEDILKRSEGLNFGYCSLELFQKGTSALLKAQYNIALDYFSAFEGTNITNIYELENIETGMNERIGALNMLLVELHFSKGICLRHLKDMNEAQNCYDTALNKCIYMLSQLNEKVIPPVEGDYITQHNSLSKYIFDKLFKILEDYIILLYDEKNYLKIYKILDNILNIATHDNNKLMLSEAMKIFLYSTCNESKILYELQNNKPIDKLLFKDISKLNVGELLPFCEVLDNYFKILHDVICDKEHAKNIKKSSRFKSFQTSIRNAIQTQAIPSNHNREKDIYAGWILSDLKNAISNRYKNEAEVRYTLLDVTSMVDDCRRQIGGRKRQEKY